jgi:hypothetical protein
MSNNIAPDMLAYLEQERQYSEARSGTRIRRVKIEKPGQAWLVRFLPVSLGKSGVFFVRNAQHWYKKTPITCPRNVSPDFGGDPDAPCPVCEVADELNAEQHEEISNFGWRLRANATWLTYCLVFQIDPGRGEPQELPLAEVLKPWEFAHYKSTFDELCDYYRRGRTKDRPLSVLDLEHGNDFWATKTKKGIRLDRGDQAPVFELGPNFDKYLDVVFAAITEPTIKIPTQKDLETYARKAKAAAYGDDDSEGVGARGHSRGRVEESDDDATDVSDDGAETRPRSRRMLARGDALEEAPARVGARRPAAAVIAEVETDPTPEASPDEDAPGGQAPVDALRAEADDDQVPGAEVPAAARSARVSAEPPPARASRSAPAAAPAAAPVMRRTAVPTRQALPSAASTGVRRMAAAAAPVAETVTEEEDPGVAEEVKDPAAAAAVPLPASGAGTIAPAGGLRGRLADRLRQARR